MYPKPKNYRRPQIEGPDHHCVDDLVKCSYVEGSDYAKRYRIAFCDAKMMYCESKWHLGCKKMRYIIYKIYPIASNQKSLQNIQSTSGLQQIRNDLS